MVIHISTLLKHYKRKDIQEAILACAKDKEIAVRFNTFFGKRPDILLHPQDILEFAKKGATSFHCSEELWLNPLQLSTSLKRKQLDELRKGWDLLLDIDCDVWQYSQIAADLLIQALKYNDVSSVSVKFSGNHGFHIAVPFEVFPEIVYEQPVKEWFPEGPRRIAAYLKEMIRPHLAERLLEKEDIATISKKVNKSPEEIIKNNTLNPFSFLEIDTVLISSRHLYRMPYSFNEKSGLVSIPVAPEKIMHFTREQAEPKNVVVEHNFLDRTNIQPNEARQLVIEAFDFVSQEHPEQAGTSRVHEGRGEVVIPDQPLPEEYFPPCVRLIQKGLTDGRKRAVFIIINFLDSIGWSHEEIKQWLHEWNKKNYEPLRETYIVGQLRYHQQQKKHILPPNCINPSYMKGIGVCKPDNFCKKIKNPAQYTKLKAKILQRQQKSTKKDK